MPLIVKLADTLYTLAFGVIPAENSVSVSDTE